MTKNAILLSWLESVERGDAAGYVPIDFGLLPAGVRGALAHWGRQILVPAANPYREPDLAQHSAHLSTASTNDLVRSVHEALDVSLTVIQALNFALIRVEPLVRDGVASDPIPLAPLPGDASTPALLDRLASALFVPGLFGTPPSLQLAETTDHGPIFSSHPDADPMNMSDWQARIDAGSRDGTPFFFVYKKQPQLLGYPSGSERWFDDAFRDRYRA
jgi:hypothetical protein